jgi:hypothetical protein
MTSDLDIQGATSDLDIEVVTSNLEGQKMKVTWRYKRQPVILRDRR